MNCTYFARCAVLGGVAASLAVLSGCTTPEEEFNAFRERYDAQYPPVTVVGCEGDACTPPTPPAADGGYLFTLSAVLDPAKPVLFDAQVTFDGTGLSFTLQPLAAADRMTPVGTAEDFGPFAVGSDGCFEADFPPLDVAGEANPISGGPITADVVLTGRLCEDPVSATVTFCGGLAGNLIMPFDFDLSGSTFTFVKLAAPGMYPEPPPINCAGDPAEPL